jgi:uncharacterized protein (TIGR03435 family)
MRIAVLLFLAPAALLPQSAMPPAFEAAAVKLGDRWGTESGSVEHGRVIVKNATLRDLVGAAYHVGVGLLKYDAKWINEERYDVAAKADPATTEDGARVMLQALLAEQFKLSVHREPKQEAVLLLKVAKDGPKFKESRADSSERAGCRSNTPLDCHNVTMASLVSVVTYAAGMNLQVFDETGLKGRYDFKLFWAPSTGGATMHADADAKSPEELDIFSALPRQLGLYLEKAKRSLEYVVIDHAEQPALEK